MSMRLIIHPRIHKRHPELSDEDVRTAFNSIFSHVRRATGECVGVGVDKKNRLVEMVFRETEEGIVVYHAFTPPTQKTMRALRMIR